MATGKHPRSSINIDHRVVDMNVPKTKDEKLLMRLRQMSYPIDYEKEISSNIAQHTHDPLQYMLNFPVDDVSAATKPRQLRTVRTTVPVNALSEAANAFVRETLQSYTTDWSIIRTKYSEYSGNFTKLPVQNLQVRYGLQEQKFEIDMTEDDIDGVIVDEDLQITPPKETVFVKSYLTIAPNSNDSSLTLKSNRRMWFYLKTNSDGSYVIEYFKGRESQLASGSILLPESTRLTKFNYDGKQHGFSLQLPDMTYGLIADSIHEREIWYNALCKALGSEKFIDEKDSTQVAVSNHGSLRDSLLHSRCNELMKLAKELDFQNALKRTESNRKLFAIYPDLESAEKIAQDEALPEVTPFVEQFGTRFIVRPKELLFRLNMNIDDAVSNVEPFFITMALYDVQDNIKLSEDMHCDLNHSDIRDMLPEGEARSFDEDEDAIDNNSNTVSSENFSGSMNKNHMATFNNRAYCYKQEAIFSVTCPGPHIFMVVRIEKVLQGGISACLEPYLKSTDNPKLPQKVHKQVASICGRLGNYRMPFGWAFKPIFKNTNGDLDQQEFSPVYKQDFGKLTDEDILKILADVNKIKLPTIPANFAAAIDFLGANQIENCVTPSIQPLKPFKNQSNSLPTPVTKEIDEFLTSNPKALQPHLSYYNNLYVYPINIKYDGQKSFARARNLAWTVHFYDSDEPGAAPLKCIYGEKEQAEFVSSATCPLLYHNTNPSFYCSIKIALPVQLHAKHHLQFRLSHISVEQPKSNEKYRVASNVGYAWLPLLQDGRIIGSEHTLPVAKKLCPGYLSSQSLGLKRGFSGPQDIDWVENGRPLVRVSTYLKSTIYSQDPHFQKFFSNYQLSSASTLNSAEIVQLMKALHAVELNTLIPFLPVLCNQLFRILRRHQNIDVAVTAVGVLIYIASKLHVAGRTELLSSYVKFIFVAELGHGSQNTVHEELIRTMTIILEGRPNIDPALATKLLNYSWFFFDIVVKSMAQFLVQTSKLKTSRIFRYTNDYLDKLEELVVAFTMQIRERPDDTSSTSANQNLAYFFKSCLTYMNRGFIMKLIKFYVETLKCGDQAKTTRMKFDCLQILCNHEHFVPLNLPYEEKPPATFELTEDYHKKHPLVGLLLKEISLALDQNDLNVRKHALRILRNLLIKHDFDDRYYDKTCQARISMLYVRFFSILFHNVHKIKSSKLTSPTDSIPASPYLSEDIGNISNSASNQSLTSIGHGNGAINANTAVNTFDRSATVNRSFSGVIVPNAQTDDIVNKEVPNNLSSLPKGLPPRSVSIAEHENAFSKRFSSMKSPMFNAFDRKQHSSQFDEREIQDMLICFLYILRNLDDGVLFTWWKNAMAIASKHPAKQWEQIVEKGTNTFSQLLAFFDILRACLSCFRYAGKKSPSDTSLKANQAKAALEQAYHSIGTRSLSYSHFRTTGEPRTQRQSLIGNQNQGRISFAKSEKEILTRTALEGNLANEVGFVVLSVLEAFCIHFKTQLEQDNGDNVLMRKLSNLLVLFLQICQSECLLEHVFAAIRSFINKFPVVLFRGTSSFCATLCYEILQCCRSKLYSVRQQASLILYLLMRSNFEYTGKDFVRVNLQATLAISRIISGAPGNCDEALIKSSLNHISSLVSADEGMKHTLFPSQVYNLLKRLRTVLVAMNKMKQYKDDPELLIELQYSLAQSYVNNPQLRQYWLEQMCTTHDRHGNLSEAALCQVHIAALIAEYMQRKKSYDHNCKVFVRLSQNIIEEENLQDDKAGEDVIGYTEDLYITMMEKSVPLLFAAERYELVGEVYRLMLPIYERKRHFQQLADAYGRLHDAYRKIVEVMITGNRFLGTYYRVSFFGQEFEDDDGKEYIYKEPKVTGLSEISQRLNSMYNKRFDKEVAIIQDSGQVDIKGLDTKKLYIQVTYVNPYFDEEELESRITEFERSTNLHRFMYETPFTLSGKTHGSLSEQYKRKTVLTTSRFFPYIKKRLLVVQREQFELTPVEVAIDEMQSKISQLNEVIKRDPPDMKKLQLVLQGCVSVQVNAGPMAYAKTFLSPKTANNYASHHVEKLRSVYRSFLTLCGDALEINGSLIKEDQRKYQEQMTHNYDEMIKDVTVILGAEKAVPEEDVVNEATV